jgi:hypothetical protein
MEPETVTESGTDEATTSEPEAPEEVMPPAAPPPPPETLPPPPATERAQAVEVGRLEVQCQQLQQEVSSINLRLNELAGHLANLGDRVSLLVREVLEEVLAETLEDGQVTAHEATRLSVLQRMMIG